jgi:uncharacterized membrane protein
MKPLILLLLVFIISIVVTKAFTRRINWRLSAMVSMSVMFVFTAIAHFAFTEGMSRMLPYFIPYKTEIIYATGVIEFMLAIALLNKKTMRIAAVLLILFLTLVLPANIYAAMHQVNYADVSIKGQGVLYLWFRIPLQLFFIGWLYFAAIYTRKPRV